MRRVWACGVLVLLAAATALAQRGFRGGDFGGFGPPRGPFHVMPNAGYDGRFTFVRVNNTDVSQFWEWSGTGLRPIDDTNEAYKLGVNYIIYGLTH